jgi:VWFA-related protein
LPELRRSRSGSDVEKRRPKEWLARAVVTTCALILALADAGSPGGVRAQQAPPAAGQPTFRTEANFILTDAFVTKDGQPVTDLKVEDFEVKEDGVLQTIKSFEYIHITRGMTSGRRDPSTVAESAAAASDPRRRVFVLFLDTFHVTRASSMEIRKTLMTFVQSMLGPDDLIALVTPQMGGSDLSFTSRPDTILGYFTNNPIWGVADELPGTESDEVEKNLSGCVSGDWLRLRMRLREKRTFQAMRDTVRYLDGLRESRKAIIMVSEGWNLYRANERVLTDSTQPARAPGRPVIGVGPDGRLGDQSGRNRTGSASPYDCDTLRGELSNLDTSEQFRNEIIGEANRANASYYTIDAARLRAGIQTPIISTDPVIGLAQARNPDREPFSTPLQTLKTLGPATNGLAIVDSNDLSAGLRRVMDDFNSFYLLGYNSTNSRLDGKYRKIAVKVKRPGVQVRSREGYTAGTPGTRGAPAVPGAPAATPASDAETMVTAALSRIAPARAGVPFLLYAAAGGAGPDAIVRVVAELEGALVQTPDWREGGEATVTVRNGAGATLGSAVSKFAPGERIIRIDVPMAEGGAASGDLRVQVRVTGTGALARFTDATNVKVDAATPRWGAPLVLRRGPTTGTAYVPTADLRFRRQERVRVELPSPRDSVTAALVDRRGKPMEIPVRVDAATPEHALTADVSLAPLAAGDYAIVLTVGEIHLAVPIRVIP